MPRYYLHLRYGRQPDKLAVDNEGDELPGLEAVRPHALAVARDLRRTRTGIVRDWFTCSFEITDEAGRPVMTVPFEDSVPEIEQEVGEDGS